MAKKLLDAAFEPYSWRGKKYKTIRLLHKAILKEYPKCGLSFTDASMVLYMPDGSEIVFRRQGVNIHGDPDSPP